MTTSAIQAAANEIFEGREALRQIAPIAERHGLTTLEEAYQVQTLNTARWINGGRRARGFKVGLTSDAVQAQLGVDAPDLGRIWADQAYDDGSTVSLSHFMQPKAEAEIAFVLKRDLDDPTLSLTDLMSAIDYAVPAIEIVDSVIEDWKIGLIDTVADNASGGGYVLGASPRTLDRVDLRLAGSVTSVDGIPKAFGVAAACMGNPLNAALWLARTLAGFGDTLAAGDVILSGALSPMVPVAPNQSFTVEIQGFAPLSVRFEE
ncbi:MAG: fumarylacetoacetate hydrolase family protein [Pseudomonadota bacterium]|nr:fumarylacetoacetate hydrolase family protein [Pseudomonadota bacterium]